MTYATQQDLVDRFGESELIQLTDRATPPAGAINATVVSKALADADAEIDGYLAARYTLPLAAPVPAVLVRVAGDIARYYLHEDRTTEQVAERYKQAVRMLTAISRGDMSLGPNSANEVPAVTGGVDYSAAERQFTRDALSDYA